MAAGCVLEDPRCHAEVTLTSASRQDRTALTPPAQHACSLCPESLQKDAGTWRSCWWWSRGQTRGTCGDVGRGREQGLRWQQLEPLPPADSVSAQPQPQPLRLEATAQCREVAELCWDARGRPVLCNRKRMLLTSVPPRVSLCWALALKQHALLPTGSCPSPFSHPGPSSLLLVIEL